MDYSKTHRHRKRYTTPNPYSQSSQELKIFWAPEYNMYACKTPPGGEKLQFDFRLIDHSRWEPTNKVWLVPEAALADAIAVLMDNWPDRTPEIMEKPDSNAAIDSLAVTDAATAALKMFQIGGYDNAKKVYSMLVKNYHPDINPDPTAHAKAAEITTAWKTLKNCLGWN